MIEDTILTATGALSATDPDAGLDFIWSIVGGTPTSDANYLFAMDSFRIAKNGGLFFLDNFDNLDPPPSTVGHLGISTATTYVTSGTFTESGDRLGLDAANASGALAAGSDTSFVGNFAALQTDVNSADLASGLKSDDTVVIQGTYDLSAVPDSIGESVGIRFIDRLVSAGLGGDDTVELRLTYTSTNQLVIRLADRDFTAGTSGAVSTLEVDRVRAACGG